MSLPPVSRREMIQIGAAVGATAGSSGASSAASASLPDLPPQRLPVQLTINGEARRVVVDSRTTLLDLLREQLGLTGSKKGCDHGQCGACTVLVDGRRINSCLSLVVMHEGGSVTTIEGLGDPEHLHPMQAAFLKHDGFQCGYCTPGQICSAVGMLAEAQAGFPSSVTADLRAAPRLDGAEVRERMSGGQAS